MSCIESIGQEHQVQKFSNCERGLFSVREKKKHTEGLDLLNTLLNRHLLLLLSHRHTEVTDTLHLHKPPVALSCNPAADNRINPTAL